MADLDPRLPKPLLLMDWRLTDHRGEIVTPADWMGKPAMVFFGFTWCPDVCATTVLDISDWLEDLGSDADDLTVAFFTVDPRDTPEVLVDYVGNFHPRITGVSGAPDQIRSAAEDFRVKVERIPREDGDYTINHTACVPLPFRRALRNVIDFHEDRRHAVPKIRRVMG